MHEGGRAASDARLAKLLARIRDRGAAVAGLAARYVHFADLEAPLDAREEVLLERLLTYGPPGEPPPVRGASLLVVPRPGTVSPWSS
ncbi:MAG: hypothetical protein R3263_04945, partial [Myxococcota bacterium]|nr:hypothetical protein [Myxococcota bacterium]